ncbi:hypothetical protein THII_0791 [Thioploca ingrica]|uniref:Secreted protein n=1 Tax=Thioploca ingrica TaxID=40754 RepID=A0A090ABQ8_9GAMM|nr:hypothetical protein THII_0791 [Thioploca ingrica]
MKSIKLTSVLLSGILATLATVPANSSTDDTDECQAVEEVAPLTTDEKAVADVLGNTIDYCPPDYELIGNRLCLSYLLYGPSQYKDAQYDCMDKHNGGRLASADDYYYARKKGKCRMNVGVWLGPRTGDNLALFNNLPNNYNDPDGETSVFNSLFYRCALGPNWY